MADGAAIEAARIGSSSGMISMARNFGAPVTEPPGNSASQHVLSPKSALSSAVIPETI